jgi:prepilin-type N-terminal cleavage/methylation domain-containing protein
MRRATGFTLMETLAAVLVLGLLAAAAVPMLRRLDGPALAERLEAQAALRLLAQERQQEGVVREVPGRPGWSVHAEALAAGPEPPPPPGQAPADAHPHRWLLLRLRTSGGTVLAEQAVVEVAAP